MNNGDQIMSFYRELMKVVTREFDERNDSEELELSLKNVSSYHELNELLAYFFRINTLDTDYQRRRNKI